MPTPMRRPSGSRRFRRSRTALRLAAPSARGPERLRIVAAVKMLFREFVQWHLLGPDEVFHPHLEGLKPRLPRDEIEHELERVTDACSRDAPVGKDWTFI